MSGDRTDVSEDIAIALMRQWGVLRFVELADCGADLNFRLGNGQVLTYWAGSDAGPPYWWLWNREPVSPRPRVPVMDLPTAYRYALLEKAREIPAGEWVYPADLRGAVNWPYGDSGVVGMAMQALIDEGLLEVGPGLRVRLRQEGS